MGSCSITFLPDNKTVVVETGQTLMEAASAAGLSISSVCGGEGICGKCRVRVQAGSVASSPNLFLSAQDEEQGIVLACQSQVQGDVTVEVPPESRNGHVAKLVTEAVAHFERAQKPEEKRSGFPHDPLVRKLLLELPAPSGSDNICDQDRVLRALSRDRSLPSVHLGLNALRELPTLLRQSDWKVTAWLGYADDRLEVIGFEPGDTTWSNLAVAVDIGTTTLAAHLIDVNASETLGAVTKYNSQARYGADVISRIMYAGTKARLRELRAAVVGDINELIAALAKGAGVRPQAVGYVLCAGNTTMTHLLLGLDPSQIRRDPYVPLATHPPTIRAREIGVRIHPCGLLSVLPSVSSYVGGDVVADVLMAGMTETEEVSLLIDLGTNGELVLGNSEWLLCASASAGPAFEGGGITCGMHATEGAIEWIRLGARAELLDCGVIGGGRPLGLCGSGIIDAVGELLRAGCIDRRGRFIADACGQRLREGDSGDREFVLFSAADTAGTRDIVITEADISNLIHSKGSIYMASECLLEYVGLGFEDLSRVYIAGGFGSHLKIDKAIEIGLLPDIDRQRFQYIGNGSVQGATAALLSRPARRYLQEKIAGSMTYLELSTYHKYMNEYSSCLFLPHTDIEKFPSLAGKELKAS